jgi:Flp pilus assembly pilin Flp
MVSWAASRGLISAFRELLANDGAAALTEYAIVASVFGVLMIALMVATQNAAGSNITSTQNGLSSESGAP